MAEKRKIENKSENNAPKTKSIDWTKIADKVIIVGLKGNNLIEGEEYPVTKETAKILVERKKATLK